MVYQEVLSILISNKHLINFFISHITAFAYLLNNLLKNIQIEIIQM